MWDKYKQLVMNIIEVHRWWLIAQGVTILGCIGLLLYTQTQVFVKAERLDTQKTAENPLESDGKRDDIDKRQNNTSESQKSFKNLAQGKETTNAEVKEVCYVDVKGSVRKPGIYQIHHGRVTDAIRLAGGPNDEADLKQVNQAQKLSDEMVIYVPAKGEDITNQSTMPGNKESNGNDSNNHVSSLVGKGVININQASESELMSLPGVGQKRAQDIIDFRSVTPFQAVSDLSKVSGIGQKMLDKLMPLVTV